MAALTLEELEDELAALRVARTELLTNGGFKEVWRDGRKIVYDRASIADLNAAIKDVESQIAMLEAAEAAGTTAKPRYRALRPRF